MIIIANICVYVRKAALKLEMKMKKWKNEREYWRQQKSVNAPVEVERSANHFKCVHFKDELKFFSHMKK